MASKLEEKVCVVCGIAVPQHRVVCSILCRNKLNASKQKKVERLERVCEVCGESFYLYPSYTNEGRYCSNKCYGVAISSNKNYGYKPRIELKCARCGKSFFSSTKNKEQTRKYCSVKCSLPKGTNTKRGKSGKRKDLDNLYVRSSWEANYARYLNYLVTLGEIARWEYEPDTFEFLVIKRGSRFYTPDFKVYKSNGHVEYHEVKGWMDKRSKVKLKRMTKYFPDTKIVVVDKKAYKDIEAKYKLLLPGWEGC